MLQRVNPLVPTDLKNEPTDSPVGLSFLSLKIFSLPQRD